MIFIFQNVCNIKYIRFSVAIVVLAGAI